MLRNQLSLPHDVRHFHRLLLEKLEPSLKRQDLNGLVRQLFYGTLRVDINCPDINFKTALVEDFYCKLAS